jgi:hypothetical protein
MAVMIMQDCQLTSIGLGLGLSIYEKVQMALEISHDANINITTQPTHISPPWPKQRT